MKKKKRLVIKDKILKKIVKNEERKGIKKDFFELLKRAVSS
jgi:hypothetical protein